MTNFNNELAAQIKSSIINNVPIGTALLGAYFGKKPISKAAIGPHLGGFLCSMSDDNRKLTPMATAIIEYLLESDEAFAGSEIVKRAKSKAEEDKAIADAVKTVKALSQTSDAILMKKAASDLRHLTEEEDIARAVWGYIYNGVPLPEGESFWKIERHPNSVWGNAWNTHLSNGKISFSMQKAADAMIADGTAPSREMLGLEERHTLTLSFPTAADKDAFLSRWKGWLGDAISNARKRLTT